MAWLGKLMIVQFCACVPVQRCLGSTSLMREALVSRSGFGVHVCGHHVPAVLKIARFVTMLPDVRYQ